MGANEKHAATYHGGEYTPSMDAVRDAYVIDRFGSSPYSEDQAEAEFGRFLSKVRAEAKAEALNDMAHVLEADIPSTAHENGQIIAGRHIIQIIRARANQYKETQ